MPMYEGTKDGTTCASSSFIIIIIIDVCLVHGQVVLNSVTTRGMMSDILAKAPNVKFVQSHFAGVDHLLVPELVHSDIQVSNAKGLYASRLAEFAIMGCTYFAKDLP